MNKSLQYSPQHGSSPKVSPRMSRILHTVKEHSRQGLLQTTTTQLEKIKASISRQLELQQRQNKLAQRLLKQRMALRKSMDQKLHKTLLNREFGLKDRQKLLKFMHDHVKEVHVKKTEMEKQKARECRKQSEQARVDIQKRFLAKKAQMYRSFKNIRLAKTVHADAVGMKIKIYDHNMNFADRSRDEVLQRLMKAEKNYHLQVRKRVQSLEPHRQQSARNYETAQKILDSRRDNNIHNLMFAFKRSDYVLNENEKQQKEKNTNRDLILKDRLERLKESRKELRQHLAETIQTCRCRARSQSFQEQRHSLEHNKSQMRDTMGSGKFRSTRASFRGTSLSNFNDVVQTHKSKIMRKKSAKDHQTVQKQNNLYRVISAKKHILNKAQSLRRSAVFNYDRVNPQSLAIM